MKIIRYRILKNLNNKYLLQRAVFDCDPNVLSDAVIECKYQTVANNTQVIEFNTMDSALEALNNFKRDDQVELMYESEVKLK